MVISRLAALANKHNFVGYVLIPMFENYAKVLEYVKQTKTRSHNITRSTKRNLQRRPSTLRLKKMNRGTLLSTSCAELTMFNRI